MKLYGIANCSTVKKARDWLSQHHIEVEFHDFKIQGLDANTAQRWLKQADWTQLVNRSGMTWRKLPEQSKQTVQDVPSALALMLEKTSVIKRPLLEREDKLLHIGFDESAYTKLFDSHLKR
jgi:Spx/MgsR family transcriptional regulator